MSDEDPTTQKTEKGTTIPIPSRDDVLGALRKVAKADEDDEPDQSPSSSSS